MALGVAAVMAAPVPVHAQPPAGAEAEATAGAEVAVGVDASVAAGVEVEPLLPINIEYGIDVGFGMVRAPVPSLGFASAFGFPINLFLTRWLGIGVRGQLVHSTDPGLDGPINPERVDDVETETLSAWSATGGLRIRIWTDEADRQAWVIDADGGWVWLGEDPRWTGALARLIVGRMVGFADTRGNGLSLGVSVAAEIGFGDARDYGAVVLNTWFHGEGGMFRALNAGEPESPAGFPYTFTIEVAPFLATEIGGHGTDAALGLAYAVGFPITSWLEPRVRIDGLYLSHPGEDGTIMLGAAGGARVRFDRWVPLFLDAYGGWEESYGTEPHPIGDGPFADVGTGYHALGCEFGAEFGLRFRAGLGEHNGKLAHLMLVLAGSYGSWRGALGGDEALRRQACDGAERQAAE